MENSINVQTIMQEIRGRIRQRSVPPHSLPDSVPASQLPDMRHLETMVSLLDSCKSRVGEMPPQPLSFRGWAGGLLVKIVRRMLFWYTPQIREFQVAVAAGFEQQLAAIRALATAIQQNGELLLDSKAGQEKLERALAAETQERKQLVGRLETEIASRAVIEQRLTAELRAREQLSERLEAESERFRRLDVAIHQLRAENSHQSARISILLEEARRRSVVSNEPQPANLSEDNHKLDGFYSAFEYRFRGSRAEIEERLRYYLPWIEKYQIGTSSMPIVDLGCGRGEWLELLSGAKLDAYGVDTNRIFAAYCRERGLRVIEQDALQHLRGLPDSRLGAITGFHIIEHLPLDVLVKLIDEAVRVLKPGGLAIFETPNPQNILVGAHNFYLDPTHMRPIPAPTAQFLLEARGLCDVEIVHLHPYAEAYQVRDGGTELAQRFNDYFYGPQDYAVIGRRV